MADQWINCMILLGSWPKQWDMIIILLCIVMSFDEFMNSCSHEVHVLHQEGKCHTKSLNLTQLATKKVRSLPEL